MEGVRHSLPSLKSAETPWSLPDDPEWLRSNSTTQPMVPVLDDDQASERTGKSPAQPVVEMPRSRKQAASMACHPVRDERFRSLRSVLGEPRRMLMANVSGTKTSTPAEMYTTQSAISGPCIIIHLAISYLPPGSVSGVCRKIDDVNSRAFPFQKQPPVLAHVVYFAENLFPGQAWASNHQFFK